MSKRFTGSYRVPWGVPSTWWCHTGAEPSTQHSHKQGWMDPPAPRTIRSCGRRDPRDLPTFCKPKKIAYNKNIQSCSGCTTSTPQGQRGGKAALPPHPRPGRGFQPPIVVGFSLWVGETGVQSLRALSL